MRETNKRYATLLRTFFHNDKLVDVASITKSQLQTERQTGILFTCPVGSKGLSNAVNACTTTRQLLVRGKIFPTGAESNDMEEMMICMEIEPKPTREESAQQFSNTIFGPDSYYPEDLPGVLATFCCAFTHLLMSW